MSATELVLKQRVRVPIARCTGRAKAVCLGKCLVVRTLVVVLSNVPFLSSFVNLHKIPAAASCARGIGDRPLATSDFTAVRARNLTSLHPERSRMNALYTRRLILRERSGSEANVYSQNLLVKRDDRQDAGCQPCRGLPWGVVMSARDGYARKRELLNARAPQGQVRDCSVLGTIGPFLFGLS